jgi:NAD(P)-dependent dehydrogenase (short-subunit alcohol dehydrogenase family)
VLSAILTNFFLKKVVQENAILVTGSIDGIGLATAQILAKAGHSVILHGRNAEKGAFILKKMRIDTQNEHLTYKNANFANLADVRRLGENLADSGVRLRAVIHNAAVWEKSPRLSADGHDWTMAVNFLAPFLLNTYLSPLMVENGDARIILVAAMVHDADFNPEKWRSGAHFSSWSAYAQSKFCLINYGMALAERLKNQQIAVNSVHPGIVKTKMLAATGNFSGSQTLEAGQKLANLAVHSDFSGVSGVFFNQNTPSTAASACYQKSVQTAVWDAAVRVVEDFLPRFISI